MEAVLAGSNALVTDDSYAGTDEVRVYETAGGALTLKTQLAGITSPYGVAATDLDGDGLRDLLVVGKNIPRPPVRIEESDLPSQIGRCLQAPSGDFDCAMVMTMEGVTGFNNVRVADMDCDGNVDALIGTTGGSAVGDGELRVAWGPFAAGMESSSVPGSVGVANRMVLRDVDGDGRPNAVVPFFNEGANASFVRVHAVEEAQ